VSNSSMSIISQLLTSITLLSFSSTTSLITFSSATITFSHFVPSFFSRSCWLDEHVILLPMSPRALRLLKTVVCVVVFEKILVVEEKALPIPNPVDFTFLLVICCTFSLPFLGKPSVTPPLLVKFER